MGLFRRKKAGPAERGHEGPEESGLDEALPLGRRQADRLRSMVRETFAEHGREVTVYADRVEDDEGAEFGLWNLATVVRSMPERQWREVVLHHVRSVGEPPPDIEELPVRDLEALTHLRVVEAAGIPDGWHPSGELLGEDVLTVLTVDLPEMVSTPPETFWEPRGGVERWRRLGLANLRALVMSDELEHRRISPETGAGGFDVVVGDSFFTASTALVADDLARRFTGVAPGERGVLVAMPYRHQVAFRVIEPGAAAALSLHHLFQFALSGFADGAGPVSPHVYWFHQGRFEQVTRVVDGHPEVHLDHDLAAALGVLDEE